MNGMCTSTHPEDPEIHCDLPDIHDGAHVSLPNHWWSREPEELPRMKIHLPKEDLYYDEFNGLYCTATGCSFRVSMPDLQQGEDEGLMAFFRRREEAELATRRMFVDHQTGERYTAPCLVRVLRERQGDPDKCNRGEGHDGPHMTTDGFEWEVRAYPCPWIITGRPDHPDGETWGDDKIKCSKARGHTGKHITADGYEFGS